LCCIDFSSSTSKKTKQGDTYAKEENDVSHSRSISVDGQSGFGCDTANIMQQGNGDGASVF